MQMLIDGGKAGWDKSQVKILLCKIIKRYICGTTSQTIFVQEYTHFRILRIAVNGHEWPMTNGISDKTCFKQLSRN